MYKDIFSLIESYKYDFSGVEKKIARYFLNRNDILGMEDIAKILAISPASITRFIKKIGIANYKEFLFLYKLSLQSTLDLADIDKEVTNTYCELIAKSFKLYNDDTVGKICSLINNHSIIRIWALGFNSFCAMDFKFKFFRMGKIIEISLDEKSILLSSSISYKKNLVLILSNSADNEVYVNAVSNLKHKDHASKIILISSNTKSPIINKVDQTLISADYKNSNNFGLVSPQIPILIQLDYIYSKYIKLYKKAISKWVASEQILHNKEHI